jgi:hypothetical protein
MNLVNSLDRLLHTYGSGQSLWLGWLCVLALAALVFVVLIAVGVHRGGDSRPRPSDAGRQAALWQHFFAGRQGHGRR